jgi:predicted 3-demethylubiquinone-9 3-methyltransferase (glyoxalase superfamily)
MQKIIPHLWFDKEAKEAATFYTSLFPDSRVTNVTTLHDTPSGDADMVSFELWKHKFMAISAGPYFKFTPAVSFIVYFGSHQFGAASISEKEAREKLDIVWNKLAEGGTVLVPLGQYPFLEHYGWVQDKYGLSWQLVLANPEEEVPKPSIVPSLLFVGSKCGQAEEAIHFYLSVFKHSKSIGLYHYGKNQAPNKEGTLMFADFMLEDTWFSAMDNARQHNFDFNEAISFIVNCTDQDEIDYYWQKLSAVPEAEQCGWLKDKYGISWQIQPDDMDDMMHNGTQEQVDSVTQAFMPMKKLDIATLKKAFEGK